jgi:hypothetical protein
MPARSAGFFSQEVVPMQWTPLGRLLAATCVTAAALLTGCSSGPPAVCTDIANLKASVQSLKDTNVKADGLSSVSDELTKIKQQLQTLHSDAKDQYSSEINAMTSALHTLESTVNAAKANVTGSTLTAVASSASAVVTAGKNLASAVSSTCG